jgi:hypothetical protein
MCIFDSFCKQSYALPSVQDVKKGTAYYIYLIFNTLGELSTARQECVSKIIMLPGQALRHHLGNRLSGPVERMCMVIPFLEELFNLLTAVVLEVTIDTSQALPLDKAKPLFNLVHP